MSTDKPHDPLLDKMDALIKKHRGPAEGTATPAPPPGWLPVLTEVIKRGTPPVSKLTVPAPAIPPPETVSDEPKSVEPDNKQRITSQNTEDLANQLLQELGPKLSAVMEQQVASELRKNLDETVATLLSQLDVSVRDIVRDAVAEKLKTQKPDS